jgi:hypothetical protein
MITLPASPAPNSAQPEMLDFGTTIEGALGAGSVRVNRPGSRFRVSVGFAPMDPETADIFIARLIAAKDEGLRIPFPQRTRARGNPGSPVVDGANQTGKLLALRGATRGHVFREGGWISIADAAGQHYLHGIRGSVAVAADGTCDLPISPMLRVPFADGAVIHAAQPMIEGLVEGESIAWRENEQHLIELNFVLREMR